ncbi:UNKNOWN [Stylonychia lemnae]|uniref:Transmembrane protein n=1 Tax=Stylonychia lemnae TaxID=5949 RepID=A0A078B4A2_STYLE|nr:UNKNOWN [Stylonychia lemnae]|eukprot:CDW89081.1 UNKNOWN [Stylonychia lemnae]
MKKQEMDLNFSSSKEIQTYIQAQMGLPQSNSDSPMLRHLKDLQDLEGNYVVKDFKVNQYSLQTLSMASFMIMFRTCFNPIDFDGRILRDLKNSYKTNEIGFFITALFFGTLGWSIITYRRNQILLLKKRFVFQQYKKQKFIEESLRLRTREELIEDKVPRIEYKDYFKK